MSDADDELKHDLECLRLATDFIQLSRDTLNPELQAHFIRMANHWTEQADRRPDKDLASPDDLFEFRPRRRLSS